MSTAFCPFVKFPKLVRVLFCSAVKTEAEYEVDDPLGVSDRLDPDPSFLFSDQHTFTASEYSASNTSANLKGACFANQLPHESVNPAFEILGDTADTNFGSPSSAPNVNELSTYVQDAQGRLTSVPSRSLYKCNTCGVFYAKKQVLKRHILQNHELSANDLDAQEILTSTSDLSDSGYKCNKCGRLFTTRFNLHRHTSQFHENKSAGIQIF